MTGLSVRNLVAGYGDAIILDDVTLTVAPGELVTVIGPNGAGKSTLLKAICGLLGRTRGTIEYEGRILAGQDPEKLTSVGINYVPQVDNVFPSLSILENLKLGLPAAVKDSDRMQRLDAVVEEFPFLGTRLHQRARTLSGGERQMLAFGRARMTDPSLLLLDEPTAGTAPKVVEEILQHVKRINESGAAVLLIEQNAIKAMEISDRVYLLEGGKNALEGTPEELMRNPELFQIFLGAEGSPEAARR